MLCGFNRPSRTPARTISTWNISRLRFNTAKGNYTATSIGFTRLLLAAPTNYSTMPKLINLSVKAAGSGALRNKDSKNIPPTLINNHAGVSAANRLNPTPMLHGFVGGSIPGVLQRVTNVSAGGHTKINSPKLLLYCAGLVAAVPSLIGMPTSATLSLCAGKNSRRDKLSDVETTEKTSNRKKKKLAESDEEYVDKKSTAG